MYIDYSEGIRARKRQHKKGESSTCLQHLVLTAFKAQSPNEDSSSGKEPSAT
jgi:hypothetical protein